MFYERNQAQGKGSKNRSSSPVRAAIWCSFFLSLAVGNAALAQTGSQTGCTSYAWVDVPGAGITNGSGPVAVVHGDDLHLFVRGQNDYVWSNVFRPASTGWSGWFPIDGGVWGPDSRGASRPAAAVWRDHLYLFAIGVNDRIHITLLHDDGSWGTWVPLPVYPEMPASAHGLAATSFWTWGGREELHLFARGNRGQILSTVWSEDGWTHWYEIPGGALTTHGPAATTLGSLYLYIRAYSGSIWQNSIDLNAGAWTGWQEVPGGALTTADPGAAGSHAGMMLSIRGGQSHIWQNLSPPGGWSEVPGNGRAAASAGPAVVVYQGLFLLFISGPDDHIQCSVATAGG